MHLTRYERFFIALVGKILIICLFIVPCYAGDAEYYNTLGKESIIAGNYSDAISFFTQAVQLDPKNATLANNRGIAYLRSGDCEAAEKSFRSAVNETTIRAQVLKNLVLSLRCQGKNVEASQLLHEVTNDVPLDPFSLYHQGMLAYDEGEYALAEDFFKKASSLSPNDTELLRSYGIALAALGRYDEGQQLMDQVLLLSPTDELAYYNKGIMYEKMGRFKDAVDAYNHTLELDKKNEGALFNKGIILWNHYLLNESLITFDSLLAMNPNLSEAWFFRGLVLKQQLNIEESTNSFKKAVDLSPDDQMYRAYLNKYSSVTGNPDLTQKITLSSKYRFLQIAFPFIIILLMGIGGIVWGRKRLD